MPQSKNKLFAPLGKQYHQAIPSAKNKRGQNFLITNESGRHDFMTSSDFQ